MILVVDDHPDSAEYLARLMRRVGFQTGVCPGGAELMACLETTPASLIILDVMMPGMDGIECLRRLQDHPRWREIPVIMYSADFAFDRARTARDLGAREYVVKGTITWADFLEIIQKHVSRGGAATDN